MYMHKGTSKMNVVLGRSSQLRMKSFTCSPVQNYSLEKQGYSFFLSVFGLFGVLSALQV